MSHLINVVWWDPRVNTAQMLALDEAWGVLVVHKEWREWVNTYRTPADPYLGLTVTHEVPERRLRKTKTGASLQLPSAEVLRAHTDGTLVDLYVGVIRDLHVRWAVGHGHPAPPGIPNRSSTRPDGRSGP
jgi:hypothetical protein